MKQRLHKVIHVLVSDHCISFCFIPLENQVFSRKLEEVGRVLFLISLTQRMPAVHKQSHVSLLQEDLLRLPSFPRTAIDAEFSLFSEPQGEIFYSITMCFYFTQMKFKKVF